MEGGKNNNPPGTQTCSMTIKTMTVLHQWRCHLSSNLTKTTTMMMHHPPLLASWLMGVGVNLIFNFLTRICAIRAVVCDNCRGTKQDTVLAEVDGGLGTTLQTGHPQVAWAALESGDTAVSLSSMSTAAARLPVSALAGALGTAQSQPSAAPPAATSWDADARQSVLPATAAFFEDG